MQRSSRVGWGLTVALATLGGAVIVGCGSSGSDSGTARGAGGSGGVAGDGAVGSAGEPSSVGPGTGGSAGGPTIGGGAGGQPHSTGGAGGDSSTQGGAAGSPNASCRTYASETIVTESTDAPVAVGTITSCTYDDSTFLLECAFVDPGADPRVLLYQYASTADFVAESRAMGLITAREATGLVGYPTRYTYDEQGRLSLQEVDRDADGIHTDQVVTYSEWDSEGRPTAGVMSMADGGCTGISVAVVYEDDPARTRTTTADFTDAQGCSASNTYITVETFDEHGNPVGYALAQEGNTWSFTSEITATAEICD
jgi:hypothetical protein